MLASGKREHERKWFPYMLTCVEATLEDITTEYKFIDVLKISLCVFKALEDTHWLEYEPILPNLKKPSKEALLHMTIKSWIYHETLLYIDQILADGDKPHTGLRDFFRRRENRYYLAMSLPHHYLYHIYSWYGGEPGPSEYDTLQLRQKVFQSKNNRNLKKLVASHKFRIILENETADNASFEVKATDIPQIVIAKLQEKGHRCKENRSNNDIIMRTYHRLAKIEELI